MTDVNDSVKNRSRSASEAETSELVGAFEETHTFFEDVGGGVLEAGVDVAEFGEGEEVGGVDELRGRGGGGVRRRKGGL